MSLGAQLAECKRELGTKEERLGVLEGGCENRGRGWEERGYTNRGSRGGLGTSQERLAVF